MPLRSARKINLIQQITIGMMKPYTAQNSMKALIGYVSSFDQAFPFKIRGASPSEIKTLEALVGRSLPAQYLEYLSRMGHDNGGLFLFGPAEKTDIATMIDSYQYMVEERDPITPEDCILIAEDIFPSQQLALRENGEAEPTVWHNDGTWHGELYAASLQGLLWRRAFMHYQQPSLKNYGYWIVPPTQMCEAAKSLANEMGFEQCWFSDEIVYCGQREDALLAINRYGGGCHTYLAAQNQSEFENIGNSFVDHLEAKYVRSRSI